MKKFFVGCNLGFEKELEVEIQEIWPWLLDLDGRPHSQPIIQLSVEKGGVSFEAPLHLGLQLNFFSKLANRILLRVAEWRIRDFPKMHQRFTELAKSPLMKDLLQIQSPQKQGSAAQALGFQYQIAASQSRLNHEGRILEIVEKIFGPANENSPQTLFVRMFQDECTMSLDTSGEHLHKRSERYKTGPAPLRETSAAFCARQIMQGCALQELKNVTLVDPMAGTGTMLLEAQALYQLTPRQDFPFLLWASCPKLLKAPLFRKGYLAFPLIYRNLVAFDKDPEVLGLAKERLKAAGFADVAKEADLRDDNEGLVSDNHQVFVLSNPPYGERLTSDLDAEDLLKQIALKYQPLRIGVILSAKQIGLWKKQGQKLPQGYQIRSEDDFKNGGLAVQFIVLEKKTSPFFRSIDKNQQEGYKSSP